MASRRRVSARKLKSVKPEEKEETIKIKKTGAGRFENMSANTQIYYTKVALGIGLGIPCGFLFDNPQLAGNWFLFPLLGLFIAFFFVRYVLKITEDEAKNQKLILSGTITMFVSYIFFTSLTWMFVSPKLSDSIQQIEANQTQSTILFVLSVLTQLVQYMF